MSLFPNIVEYALERGLSQYRKPTSRGEIRVNCPFCEENGHGYADNRFSLYLGTGRDGAGIFRCQRCGEKGGTLRFMSLLEKRSEIDILTDLKAKQPKVGRKPKDGLANHPAMKLTSSQWKLMGFENKPTWEDLRVDPKLSRDILKYAWAGWQSFLYRKTVEAFGYVCISYYTGKFEKAKNIVREIEVKTGIKELWENAIRMHTIPKAQWTDEMRVSDQLARETVVNLAREKLAATKE